MRVILSRSLCLCYTYGASARASHIFLTHDVIIDVVCTMYAQRCTLASQSVIHIRVCHHSVILMSRTYAFSRRKKWVLAALSVTFFVLASTVIWVTSTEITCQSRIPSLSRCVADSSTPLQCSLCSTSKNALGVSPFRINQIPT